MSPLLFVGYQVFQINLQYFSYPLERYQIGLNPITSIGIDHTETLIKFLRQPRLRDTFVRQDCLYAIQFHISSLFLYAKLANYIVLSTAYSPLFKHFNPISDESFFSFLKVKSFYRAIHGAQTKVKYVKHFSRMTEEQLNYACASLFYGRGKQGWTDSAARGKFAALLQKRVKALKGKKDTSGRTMTIGDNRVCLLC